MVGISRARLKERHGRYLSEPESAGPGEREPTRVNVSNTEDTGCAENPLLRMRVAMGHVKSPPAPLLIGPGTPTGTLPSCSQAGAATTGPPLCLSLPPCRSGTLGLVS